MPLQPKTGPGRHSAALSLFFLPAKTPSRLTGPSRPIPPRALPDPSSSTNLRLSEHIRQPEPWAPSFSPISTAAGTSYVLLHTPTKIHTTLTTAPAGPSHPLRRGAPRRDPVRKGRRSSVHAPGRSPLPNVSRPTPLSYTLVLTSRTARTRSRTSPSCTFYPANNPSYSLLTYLAATYAT